MIYIVKINNKEYEVEVEKGQANILKTTEVAVPVETVLAAPTASAATPAAPAVSSTHAASTVGEAINAPMPGTIVDVKVVPGTRVKKGDALLILEAMKMENEVVSPVDGVVSQVFVIKGSSVATNDVLLAIQ